MRSLRRPRRQPGETAAAHNRGLGNTAIVLNALKGGNIDVYPEYTGTIAKEILKLDAVPPLSELNARLAAMGLAAGVPLGFNNTYAIAMRADDARAKGISRLSDLKSHPEIRLGLSQEFIGRADGWPGLKRAYDLPFATPRGLDHGLAYEAIAGRQVDAIDIYSTDAKIDKYALTVLSDDRNYFPRYDAVLLYRADLPQRFPRTWSALQKLQDTIDDASMRRMNAEAELEGKDFAIVAANFLKERAGTIGSGAASQSAAAAPQGAVALPQAASAAPSDDFWRKLFGPDFARLTYEHLLLVFLSLASSIAIGIPLGILAAKLPSTEGVILGVTGIVQTIPALALLAMLIPLTGRIGAVPAFIALSAYALLPIVRNTHTALTQISHGHAPGCAVAGDAARNDPEQDRAAARGADHRRGDQDIGGHQRRHSDHRCVHRRRWLWRAHRDGPRAQRSRDDARRRNSRRGAGLDHRRRVPLRRALDDSGRSETPAAPLGNRHSTFSVAFMVG